MIGRLNKFYAIESVLFVGVDFGVDPSGVIGDSCVDSREIRRRATDAPAGNADQNESVGILLLVVPDDHERATAVALATVDSTGHESSAEHVIRHETFCDNR